MPALTFTRREPPASFFERVGGAGFFDVLIAHFHEEVEARPALRALYPEDPTAAHEHLRLFLIQYFGGPETYNELRGHPRLRMRHAPFTIDVELRDQWLSAMLAAVAATGLDGPERAELIAYLDTAAHQLRNA